MSGSQTILLLDGLDVTLEAVTERLRGLHCVAVRAKTADEAFALAQVHAVGAVILPSDIPGPDARSLVQALRSCATGQGMPFLAAGPQPSLDARDEHPTPSVLAPRDLRGLDDLAGVFGPYPTRKQAARAGEAVVDTLDLCRHRHLLVLTPHASPCAYKDMGRCPAPCDGSEPLETYRDRVRVGQGWLADPASERSATEAAMREAASGLDDEQAAALKAQLDRSSVLADGVAGTIAGRAWCVVLPSGEEGRVRCLTCAGGAIGWSEDDHAPDAMPSTLACPPAPDRLDARSADTLAWVGGLACLPDELNAGRRACRVIALPADEETLRAAAEDVLHRAARPRTSVE